MDSGALIEDENPHRIEPEKILKIINQLSNWDSIPEIVKSHLTEQNEALRLQRVRNIQEEAKFLEETLDRRRKTFQKHHTNEIQKHKAAWEGEWERKIESEVESVKSKHEKEIQDLNFQKRLLEISLFKIIKD